MSMQNIYDNERFFENFKSLRANEINFNDCVETPIMTEMLPDLRGKTVLDLGCGMGQHARQYADMGAASVLGIDISEKMLAYAREHNAADNVEYRRIAMEDAGTLAGTFDVATSSLAFDYVENLGRLMRDIYALLNDGGFLVFSTSHPLATAWDGVYDRYTRDENGVRLYANLRSYALEGLRRVNWVVDGYELYHRTFSTFINDIVGAGFVIEECREATVPEELMSAHEDVFGGLVHKPEFIFFRCRKPKK